MDKFIYLIKDLRWQDIIDIGLVSYILFRFYVLFRGTNAFRVLIGMTILWFFQQIAVIKIESIFYIVYAFFFKEVLFFGKRRIDYLWRTRNDRTRRLPHGMFDVARQLGHSREPHMIKVFFCKLFIIHESVNMRLGYFGWVTRVYGTIFSTF